MALDATPLDPANLPPIAAGPVLRRVTRTEASVWVALTRGDAVTLHVRLVGQPATEVATAPVMPVQVGSHLWLAVLTGGAPDGSFRAGELFEYRLSSPGWPDPNWADVAMGSQQPAFPGPPAAIEDLVVMHSSCRKAHGGGRDGLALAAEVIAERVAGGGADARPHLLILAGDQIYADEVPAPLAPRVRRLAADLVGIDETDVFGAAPLIGGRQAPSEGFGLTSSAAGDHLWSFGEYLAVYLLYWSDALWPATTPVWTDVAPAVDLSPAAGLDEAAWTDLVHRLSTFRAGLPSVRKLLATVPSIMVADDHEVTDDWNIDHPWAARVYADPAGSRIVHNGVLALALCQQWGNAPARFTTPGSAEAGVLDAAAFTGASPDTPGLRALLGVPTAAPAAPPSVLRDPAVGARYDVELGPADGWPVRVIGLDERTVREFHRMDHPAARISMAGLAAMLPGPAGGAATATIVVGPSPVMGTHVIEHVIQPAVSLLPGGSLYSDFESWPAAPANHQELLRRLVPYAPLVLLSGDVHYSGTAALRYTTGGVTTIGAQVVSSAGRNADAKTMTLHLLGDLAMRLGIERTRRFDGFTGLTDAQRAALAAAPPAGTVLPYDELVDVLLGRAFRAAQETPVVLSDEIATAYGLPAPDWTYEVEPVDDERLPAPGALLTDMTAAPDPWAGWDPAKSFTMLRALRASDLHRIGRVFVGLPLISLLTFSSGPLEMHADLICPVGDDAARSDRHHTQTRVVLG
ncbi:MAG: hypothetical protein JWR82_2289 [Blastococcus sp.]|nr:hypothetical protein [Blastococcus sp.]